MMTKQASPDNQPIVFYEQQALPHWAAIIVGVAMTICFVAVTATVIVGPRPVPALVFLILALPLTTTALISNLFFMHTELTHDALTVRFAWWLTIYRRRIALSDITRAEAVTYNPIREYGGWGIRGWAGDSVLNARGDKGVRLRFRNGDRLLVGSQMPSELADALQPAPLD